MERHSPLPGAGDVRLGRTGLLPHESASQGRHGHQRGGEAVDVEDPAPHGPAGDQRAPRASGAGGAPHDHVGGRHPQLLHPGLPDEEGRSARPLQHRLVPCHEARSLPHLLRRVLRDGTLQDDRLGGGDDARGLRGLARRGARGREPHRRRPEAVRRAQLRHLPPRRHRGPRAHAREPLRHQGDTGGRREGGGGRGVPARVHPEPGREGRDRLPAHHAHLWRTGERGESPRPDRLHQVTDPTAAAGAASSRHTSSAAPAGPQR